MLLLNIYLFGVSCSILWWMVLAYFVFNKKYDENSDSSLVKSIQELQNILASAFPDTQMSLQTTYLLLSLLVTFFWPLFLVLLLNQKLKNI